jgi:lactate permease
MPWQQIYNPLNSVALSTIVAALPIVVLLGTLAFLRMKAHWAAILGLISSLVIAVLLFHMPGKMAFATALYGAAFGLFPIGWIILNVIFLYDMTLEKGYFTIMRESLTGMTSDKRLQLLLIAFSFGGFFEGASGFGTPVAITAAILIGLGFPPLTASGLSLIANTSPVAYGALGTPIIALQSVTGLEILKLSGMVGRILCGFCVLVPFWLIWAFAGFRGMMEVWPALLVAGVFFAVPQLLVSNLHGPWIAAIVGSLFSMAALVFLLLRWHPKTIWGLDGELKDQTGEKRGKHGYSGAELRRAWMPWIILSVLVFLWGLPQMKSLLNGISLVKIPIPDLHNMIMRMPPVVAKPTAEAAIFNLNWLSATGSGILVAALISGLVMGFSPAAMLKVYGKTLLRIRFSLLTIAAMLAIGFTTRYSGLDATMGLTFARTGMFYPFFGTLLGWLGVALTGSDTSSNVLFGSLQRISAEQIGISPILMASANSAGGVMGKMIDAQSIVVASTATKWYGHEGDILRYVFFHSLALAVLVALLVFCFAYIPPFTAMVIR